MSLMRFSQKAVDRKALAKETVCAVARDSRGIAMTEFALAFPILIGLALFGMETARFALVHLRLNQITLNLADNASRVGSNSSLSTQQLRESDIEDIFQAVQVQGASIDVVANSRIILSSLEKDNAGVQRLHWQRCLGSKTGATYESHYGKALDADGSTLTGNAGPSATNGMGPTGSKVHAPENNSAVMFVEINYNYTSMFSWIAANRDLRYTASFIVRDPRDLRRIFPISGVTPKYCGYTSQVSPTA